MNSFNEKVSKRIHKLTKRIKRALSICLVAALAVPAVLPIQSSVVHAEIVGITSAYIDKIVFGNDDSEIAHDFVGDNTTPYVGGLGETARKSDPRVPALLKGGDLIFTMSVDPIQQNYLTVKFWGDEASTYKSIVYINGEQLGSRRSGDFEPLNSGNENYRAGSGTPTTGAEPLSNRFYYRTTMLPLESTYGQETMEITIRTYHENFSSNVTLPSRGYYNAYTHSQAYLDVSDEKQGAKFTADVNTLLAEEARTDVEKQALIDGYTDSQRKLFNSLTSSKAGVNDELSIVRYVDELKFYSSCLTYDWCPANTPELKKEALDLIFKSIDNHVKDYYGNTRLVQRGGHQGDWGGYYGALGEALYIVENLIADDEIFGELEFNAFLDQPFITGTVEGPYSLAGVDWAGGELTRREAWERPLKANFDFARSRLSYIYNQIMYTYEGAWEAHEGLRVIGSRFYEGKERSKAILLESLGSIPFLGEEVLVGPNGEELDVYHSLFYHDTTAVFTADVEQIIAKGLAKSKLDNGNVVRRLTLGEYFTGISEAGLTRENGYVANYGESANYLPEYFYKTLNHAGDEQLNDEILKLALKSVHARGYARHTDLADDGKRVMRMEQVLDDRNPTFSGNYGYATSINGGKALHFASLESAMVQNEVRYSGPEWGGYWKYAQEAVGYAQQQIADNQFFNNFSSLTAKNKYDYEAAKTYQYITTGRDDYSRFDSVMAGVVHPQTDFSYYTVDEITALEVNPVDYEKFAWVDMDNFYVSLRDEDTRIFGQLNMLNRGFAGNGRLHVINDDHENIVQIATNGKFQYEDYTIRMNDVDIFMIDDQNKADGDRPQALAGEINPITYQPGVGKINRENWEPDHAYSGLAELLTARYGKYFIVFNSTRDVYENEQTFDVELPTDYSGATVFDLVSGNNIPVTDGKVTIVPRSAMVLKLTENSEDALKPSSVDYVGALAGNGYAGINWKTTAGAASYTIKRSTTENGTYSVISSNVQGNYYKDTTVTNGQDYYYKVTAVNANGVGLDSYRAKLELSVPVTLTTPDTLWRDDRLGDITQGNATIMGSSIAIENGNGNGLGEGDDYTVHERDINDSLHYVSQVVSGSGSIEAKIDSHKGEASGVMMRDLIESNARYIYFGADVDGNLVLQNRTRDSRHTFTDLQMSPLNVNLIGFDSTEYPYVKLLRDYDSRYVNAYVSTNGEDWIMVHKMFTPFPYAFYAGVVATDDAQFSEVAVEELLPGIVYPFIEKANDAISLSWNKPKRAITFSVFRTYDTEKSSQNPVFVEGTNQLVEGSPWTVVASNTIDLTYVDTQPTLQDTPSYKIVPISLDGTYGEFSETVNPAAETMAPHASHITIRNNPAAITDTIEVKGLSAGNLVKVYRTTNDTTILGSAVADSSTVTISIPQIGEDSGMLYVSISEPNKLESSRTGKTYAGEDGVILRQVEKDATLRFNSAAPGNSTELTVLSNGINVEDNKRYGIITFDGVPALDDEEIESVTLKMYRKNARTATLQAHLIQWNDWIEPSGNDTLGAKLKDDYFGNSTSAIETFLAGPKASAGVTPINDYVAYDINALWDIDVTNIVKVNEGNKATFLISVPSGEANPLTKEYVAGQSTRGQFGPTLIVKYVINKSALNELIVTIDELEAEDYTIETWAALQAVLTSAEQVKLNESATQVEVNAALTNLLAAKDALKAVRGSGFEEDETDIWLQGGSGENYVFGYDTDAHRGSRSYKFSSTNPSADATLNTHISSILNGETSTFEVTGGKEYEISFWYKTNNHVRNAPTSGATVQIMNYKENTGNKSERIPEGTTDGWVQMKIPFTTHAEETRLRINFEFRASMGEVWFDDLQIITKSGLSTETLVEKIKEAEAITNDTNQYKIDSYSALQAAIGIAKSTLDHVDENTQQLEIDQAVSALQTAMDALVETDLEKAELIAQINTAKAITNDWSKYTAVSFSALQSAIIVAEAVLEDSTKQAEIDGAVIALQTAIDNLVIAKVLAEKDTHLHSGNVTEKNGGKESLVILRNEAGQQRFGIITFDISEFAGKDISGANLKLYNTGTLPDRTNNMSVTSVVYDDWDESNLDYATFSSKFNIANDSELATFFEPLTYVVVTYDSIEKPINTMGVWNADITDLIKAQLDLGSMKLTLLLTVLPGTTHEANPATKESAKGYYAPSITVDYATSTDINTDALVNAINRATAITNDNGQYTFESFETLQKAVTAAQTALANSTIQSEIDSAVIAMQTAIDGLELSEPEEPVVLNKTALEALIAAAEAKDEVDYTSRSYAALQKAIIVAQTALVNSTTQAELDGAVSALQTAIDGLVVREEPETPSIDTGGGKFIPSPSPRPSTPKNTVVADYLVTNQINNQASQQVIITLPVSTVDMAEVIAEIPANILKSLVASGKPLVIKSGDVEIAIPAGVIAAIATSQPSPDKLSIHINLASDVIVPAGDAVSSVYDLTISSEKSGTTTIISTFSEPITVQLPVLASNVNDSHKVAGYRVNGNLLEYVGGKYVDGKVVFRTHGFSRYVAIEKDITFEDIAKHWAKDAIEVLASRTITSGKGLNTFAPQDRLTRGEFAVLISRALDLRGGSYEGIFQDVTIERAWAYTDIEAAYRAGIIKGRDAAIFNPDANITREELASMIMRAIAYADASLLNDLHAATAFNDASNISSFAQEAAVAAQSLGIISGKPGNLFDPKGPATRAEAVAMLYRALEKLQQF